MGPRSVLWLVVLLLRFIPCRSSTSRYAHSERCKAVESEGLESTVCRLGGPPTQFPPTCPSKTGTKRLVINSLTLAVKPECVGRLCCQPSTKDRLYSVPCLAELEPSTALTSLERAVLVGCSGHPNCSVAQVSPISLPGLGSSAYLKVTSSCVQVSSATTIEFCSGNTLRGARIHFRYNSATSVSFREPSQCTCYVESTGNATAHALAVRQRDAGSWLEFEGNGKRKKTIRASDTLYGEQTVVFTDKQFSVTLGSLQRDSDPLVWLLVSGSSGEVEVKCLPPATSTETLHRGSLLIHIVGSIFAIIAVIVLVIFIMICCRRRRARLTAAFHEEEAGRIEATEAEDEERDASEVSELRQRPKDASGYERAFLPPPTPTVPVETEAATSSLYSQISPWRYAAPRSEVSSYNTPMSISPQSRPPFRQLQNPET